MARPTEWRRTTFVQDTANFFGHVPGIAVQPGETVIKTFWSLSVWTVNGNEPTYPPGSSLLRAGIIFDSFASPAGNTPVSQADALWMDLTTMPWHTDLEETTEVDWLTTANTGPSDREAAAMRKNDFAEPYTVYVSWELAPSSLQKSGFVFFASGSCDLLVALAAA